MPLTVLRDGHRELLRLLDEVIVTAHNGPAEELAAVRRTLAQATARHVAQKNTLVVLPLQRSPRTEHRELARRLTDEILATRQAAIEHYAIWTLAAIEADPREYRMSLRAVIRSMEKRFQYEEDEIHPRAIDAMRALAAQRAA